MANVLSMDLRVRFKTLMDCGLCAGRRRERRCCVAMATHIQKGLIYKKA